MPVAQARAVNHLVGGRSDHIGDLPAFFFIFFFIIISFFMMIIFIIRRVCAFSRMLAHT